VRHADDLPTVQYTVLAGEGRCVQFQPNKKYDILYFLFHEFCLSSLKLTIGGNLYLHAVHVELSVNVTTPRVGGHGQVGHGRHVRPVLNHGRGQGRTRPYVHRHYTQKMLF
jgi:hypothetical protein